MNKQFSFALACAAMSLVLAGCQIQTAPASNGAAQQQMAQQAQPTSAQAVRRDIVGYKLLTGRVNVPVNAAAAVYAGTTAPVETVNVKQGDLVRKGQTILTLSNGQQTDYEQAKTTYDQALAAYNQALAQYQQPVKDIQRQLAQAQDSERNLRQTTPPNGDGTNLQQATTSRQSLEDQLKVVQAQAQTNEVPYKTQLDQARVALAQAKSGARQSTVTAPISGTVVTLTATTGQTVTDKTTVAMIVDLPAMTVKSDVPPDETSVVKTGTPVAIVFNDFPDRKFVGRVRKLDTLPSTENGKVQYEATIDFTNTGGAIKPSSTVNSVGIIIGRRSGVVTVPVDAIAKDPTGKPVVKIQQSGSWKQTPVGLGLTDGNFVEIRSGVDDGDTVQVVPGQGQWILKSSLSS